MNRSILNMFFLGGIGLWLITACALPTATQSVSKAENYSYSDNAAKYRPQVDKPQIEEESAQEVKIIENELMIGEYNIDAELEAIVDSMYVRNDSIREYSGFTILVYSGNDELEAGKVRNRLFDLMPNEEAKFSYKLPTYFVKIGQYLQQLEAEPTLKMIQRTYPSAAIVPEKFEIKVTDDPEEN
jgi:hypothetical protein